MSPCALTMSDRTTYDGRLIDLKKTAQWFLTVRLFFRSCWMYLYQSIAGSWEDGSYWARREVTFIWMHLDCLTDHDYDGYCRSGRVTPPALSVSEHIHKVHKYTGHTRGFRANLTSRRYLDQNSSQTPLLFSDALRSTYTSNHHLEITSFPVQAPFSLTSSHGFGSII